MKQSLKDELSKMMAKLLESARGPILLPWDAEEVPADGHLPDDLLARLPVKESYTQNEPRSEEEMKAYSLALSAFVKMLNAQLANKPSVIHHARHAERIQRHISGASKKRPAVQGYCRALSDAELELTPEKLFAQVPDSWQEHDITGTNGEEYDIYQDTWKRKPAIFWTHIRTGRPGHILKSTFPDYIYDERKRRKIKRR